MASSNNIQVLSKSSITPTAKSLLLFFMFSDVNYGIDIVKISKLLKINKDSAERAIALLMSMNVVFVGNNSKTNEKSFALRRSSLWKLDPLNGKFDNAAEDIGQNITETENVIPFPKRKQANRA